jgi:hypothetical protein
LKRVFGMLVALTLAVLVVPSSSADPEPIKLSLDTTMPTPATDAAGADVTYHVLTTDPLGATCSAGGAGTNFSFTAHFPIGTTTLTCTAVGDAGISDSAVVTVQDTPPSIAQPPDITVSTTDANGTTVSYGPFTASDLVDGSLPVSCSPASGTTFPINSTVVTCSATDSASNLSQVTFTVTVNQVAPPDTEAPTFTSIPGPITTAATSPAGAVVNYTITATDDSGTVNISCDHPSGSTFPPTTTTVNCTATDPAGNSTSAPPFTVTVNPGDFAAPTLSNVPANLTVEANGPSGSIVNYPSPAANDAAEGPKVVTCAPASGTTFALGTTTVTCSAADSIGNTGTASFTISVVDRIAPTLIVPRDRPVYADTLDGINRGSHYVALFLSEARAGDTVDPNPIVWNDAPEFLTVGTHVVTFFARDASGNGVSKSAVLEVLPLPPPGTPPLPVPPARSAPPDVRALKAEAGDGRVRLTWQMPNGVDHVVITRTLTAGGDPQVIYTGSAEILTDRRVTNDLEYRYLVVSVNREGEASPGVAVVAAPKRTLLKAPKDGAKLKKAPKLVWLKNAEASYYNVQLFRGSVKILSAWPLRPNFLLKKSWKYQSRSYKLTPGLYRWYVWPGFGKRSAVDYGGLLGFSTFQIVR